MYTAFPIPGIVIVAWVQHSLRAMCICMHLYIHDIQFNVVSIRRDKAEMMEHKMHGTITMWI